MVTITDKQAVALSLTNWKDAEGQPASAPSHNPTYSTDNANIVQIASGPDGAPWAVAALAVGGANGQLGTANVTGSALGDDGNTISASVEIQVVASVAVHADLITGGPQTWPLA